MKKTYFGQHKARKADKLLTVAENGDIEALKSALANPDTKIHQTTPCYRDYGIWKGRDTALHIAVEKGHTEIMQLLLANGADANKANREGMTPLHLACRYRDAAHVEALLSAGANVNAKAENGMTPLSIALYRHRLDIIQRLLDSKGFDAKSWNPLTIAVLRNETQKLSKLIRKRKSVDTSSDVPLFWAAAFGREECLQLLLSISEINVNESEAEDTSPLYMALRFKHDSCAKQLILSKGIDVNKAPHIAMAVQNGMIECAKMLLTFKELRVNTCSPLTTAIENNDIELAKVLLEHPKFNINWTLKRHIYQELNPPYISMAVELDRREIASMLLSHPRIDVNNANYNRDTPIFIAIKKGRVEMVRLLLQHPKIDVNKEAHWGESPLRVAVEEGHTEIVRLLLTHPNIIIHKENIPPHNLVRVAKEKGYKDIAALIEEALASKNDLQAILQNPGMYLSELKNAVTIGDIKNAEKLLNFAYNNKLETQFETLLAVATDNNDLELVKTLLTYAQKGNKRLDIGKLLCIATARNKHQIIELLHTAKLAFSWNALNAAAEYGYLEIAAKLIDARDFSNDYLNLHKCDMADILIKAIDSDHIGILKLLLNIPGINVNGLGYHEYGYKTPLHVAYKKGQKYTKLLLQTPGVDVNDGSYLSRAIFDNDEKVVRLLLEHPEIDVNHSDSSNHTPLHTAANHGLKTFVELLLSSPKIDINIRDDHGKCALDYALQHHHFDVAETLLNHPDIDVQSWSPVCAAVLKNDIDKLKCLIQTNPQPDVTSKNPLYWAAFLGCKESVQLLLSVPGINVNIEDINGNTPLNIALIQKHIECAKLLASRKDIDVTKDIRIEYFFRSETTSLLHYAIKHNYNEIAALLLQHPNIDVNKQGDSGETPLAYAVRIQNITILKQLLQVPSIDVNKENHLITYKGTPLTIAISRDPNSPLYMEVLNLLLSHPHIDINKKNWYGKAPLHIAAEAPSLDALYTLITFPHVDINIKDNSGKTPLHIAANHSSANALTLLLKFPSIDINAQDNKGNTPLHIAAKCSSESVKFLIEAGADANAKNERGHRPTPSTSASKEEKAIIQKLLNNSRRKH